jgi:hypothetical protein
MTKLQEIANDIAEAAADYPGEARYEVVQELLDIEKREQELSAVEYQRIVAMLCDKGII